jgi:hypothetical protein
MSYKLPLNFYEEAGTGQWTHRLADTVNILNYILPSQNMWSILLSKSTLRDKNQHS